MPFGGYENFDACVLAIKGKGHSDEEARAICGKMQKDAEMAESKLRRIKFAELSVDQIRGKIEQSLTSGWIREMYRDYVIIIRDEKLYKLPYSISEDDEITLGELQEVEMEYVPAPAEMAENFDAQWIEIFRSGDYGDKGAWTVEDLDKVITNAEAWKAPVVIGHPENDSPAMGWVAELARDGDVLRARFDQVHPALATLVSEGRYPNRSAAFYTDPQGKGPVLRHVGFLGAVPPEVKGLAPIQFSQTKFTSIDFQEDSMNEEQTKKTITEAVKAYFSDLFGKKDLPASSTFSEAQVNDMIARAVSAATTPLVEQNKAITTKFADLEKTMTSGANETKREKVRAFVERLRAAGKWIPAFDKAGVVEMLEQTAISGGTVKFGEAGKEKEFGTYEAFSAFLESLPVIVPIGGLRTGTGSVSHQGKVLHFNEAQGIELDQDSVVLNERAEKIAAERKIDFGEALKAAREELLSA